MNGSLETTEAHFMIVSNLILRMISSALTLPRSSLCSSSDTLNSFLSSVIKLSFSWGNYTVHNVTVKIWLIKHIDRKPRQKVSVTNTYPCYGIRLSLECSQHWTVGFLLKEMDLSLHIIWRPGVWSRTCNRGPSITCQMASSWDSILMWWREIVISPCITQN